MDRLDYRNPDQPTTIRYIGDVVDLYHKRSTPIDRLHRPTTEVGVWVDCLKKRLGRFVGRQIDTTAKGGSET